MSKHEKQKGDVSALVKVFFTLGVLAVLLFIGSFLYAKSHYSASAVMDEYVQAFMAKSPSRIFKTLNLELSTFVTSENLDTLLKDRADYESITSYSLVKLDESDDTCHYQVKYMVGRLESPFSQKITLKKTGEKYMFLFDRWRIDGSDLIASRVTVRVPIGAEVLIDGTRIPKSQLRKKADTSQDYELGELFAGEHVITVELDGFKPYKDKFKLEAKDYQDEPIYMAVPSQFAPDESSRAVIEKLVERIVPKYYEDLLQRRSFDFFLKEVAIEAGSREDMARQYERMSEKHVDSKTHLTYVDFGDFKSEVTSTISTDDCYALRVDTKVPYLASSTVVHNDEPEARNRKGTYKISSVFHYSGGQWWLYSSDIFGRFIGYSRT